MPALGGLLGRGSRDLGQALGPRLLEAIVAAGIEGEFRVLEMDDLVDHLVQKIAVVGDQQQRVRIIDQEAFEPERCLEVEMVGRLVEQQQIGLREQHRGKRHAHAPAAGEIAAGARLLLGIESESGQDGCGAGRRAMGVDIRQPGMDLGNAMGIVRGFCLGQQLRALRIGRQHRFQQALRPVGRFLGQHAEAGISWQADLAGIGLERAGDKLQQGRFARAIAPDKPRMMARGQGSG